MKVTILTVSLNSIRTIQETIESVLSQSYTDIEYIIIDGGSNDGTSEVLKKYKKVVQKIISAKDRGMYDALNKGIDLSTGDLIGILHSDDIFSSVDVVKDIVAKISFSKTDSIYGDLDYVIDNGIKVLRKWKSGQYNRKKLLFGWMPPHPTFFIKKEIFNKYGKYDLSFGTAADYELIVRLLYKYKISCEYLPNVITKMRMGGLSNMSISNRINAHLLDWRAWKINDISNFPIWVLLKPIRKIHQYF
jgi:glycosyltransferase involved in cell wall biosynthesis